MVRVPSLAVEHESMSCLEWPEAKEGGKSQGASKVFFFQAGQ